MLCQYFIVFSLFENLIAVHAIFDNSRHFIFGNVCDFEDEVNHVVSLAFSSRFVQIWELFTRKSVVTLWMIL